jgi:high affinity sulfate transporter 1
VAVPVGIANARLAGFDPVVGLYASILPPIAYAMFGTSRQLIVGPDAATSAVVAAALVPLAAGDPGLYASLSVVLAFLAGLFCIAGSFFRLGALADFLSRPILIGFLNGVAINILFGQAGSVLGVQFDAGGILPRIVEIVARLHETHLPTLAVALGTFAVLAVGRRYVTILPAALLAMIAAGVAVAVFGLEARGVAVLGEIPSGMPTPRLPEIPLELVPKLLADAAGIALVLFASGVLSARAFATKNRYELDVDRELAAFGVANLASAVVQGFCVTGSTSRTAIVDATGGRTQVAGLIAALVILVLVQFLAEPLRYVPAAALGAILVSAALGIFDATTLRWIWRMDRAEAALAVITMLGVVVVGAVDAILLAVGLALVRFVRITARPRDEVLGAVPGMHGLHAVERHAGARTWPGIVIYRFDGPVTFFNAAYFRQRALKAVRDAGPGVRWFALDMVPISHIDVTGVYALQELQADLARAGVKLVLAGRRTEIIGWLRDAGMYREAHEDMLYSTLREALRTFRRQSDGAAAPPA